MAVEAKNESCDGVEKKFEEISENSTRYDAQTLKKRCTKMIEPLEQPSH